MGVDMTDLSERWLPVVGFEGLYEVSSRGRVRSLDRARTIHTRWGGTTIRRDQGKLLAPGLRTGGYLTVTLYRDGVGRTQDVHILVAKAFHGPCPGKYALHRNDIPTENHEENLYWGTPKQNSQDCIANGHHPNMNKKTCKYNHRLWGANLITRSDRKERRCRACNQTSKHFRYRGIRLSPLAFRREADRRYFELMDEAA